jgi:hypothetical protein
MTVLALGSRVTPTRFPPCTEKYRAPCGPVSYPGKPEDDVFPSATLRMACMFPLGWLRRCFVYTIATLDELAPAQQRGSHLGRY